MEEARVVTGRSSAGSPFISEPNPSGRRRCTDVPCCLIFLFALAAYVALAGFGVSHGNTELLANFAGGQDYKGRRCGVDKGVEKYKKTYFTLQSGLEAPANWTAGSRGSLKAVCTSQCPEASGAGDDRVAFLRQGGLCPPDAYSSQLCTWYGARTVKLARYCVDPEVFDTSALGKTWLQDLHAAWPFIVVAFVIAVLCGFLFLTIVRRCGPFIMLSLIILVAAVPLLIGCLMHFHPATLEQAGLGAHKQKKISYWLWGASAVCLLLSCIFAKTIRHVVAVLRATSTFLEDVPSQMLQPIFFATFQLAVVGVWLAVFLAVSTVGAEGGDQTKCLEKSDLFCINWSTKSRWYAIWFLVLMLYWMLSFSHALSHYGTSLAVKLWYFTPADPITGRKVPEGSLSLCGCGLTLWGIAEGLLHHAGSLAFGALLVAAAKVMYLMLSWARHTDPQAATNPVVACIYRASLCVAKCVERFVEFTSEHAYVEMALNGHGFLKSAQEALAMAIRKPALFAMSGTVARVIQFLGIVVVTIGTILATLLALQLFPPQGLTSLDAPLVAVVLVGWAVAEVMMHPFTIAARASLHCVVMDEDHARREGRQGTVHAPQQMQNFLDNYSTDQQ